MATVTALGEPRAKAAPPSPAAVRGDRAASAPEGATLAATVVGPWNRLAHEAARRFVETRGAWSRVLLVTGGEGNGKSHLLAAVDAGLRDAPGRRTAIARASCDDFMRQFTYAATQGHMAAFRQKYRSTEVLLLDDVDRLSTRPATQEEFLHLFDHLESAGRNVVLSSRVKPRDITGLNRPLASRLAAAMQVRIEPPDDAGRRNLLQLAALRDRRTLSPDILAAAASPAGSARDVLARWGRMRELATISVGAATAAAGPVRPPGPTLHAIVAAVAGHYGLKPAEISGSGRSRRLTVPRHVCFHLAKKLTAHSLQEIAAYFGGRNHATVLYACRKVALDLASDKELTRVVAATEQRAVGGAKLPG
ncbi:MAG: ATP-binding protein [Planctomycetes bacterium]|nr:ATP-binding protein [Planctomycetota bacterium]